MLNTNNSDHSNGQVNTSISNNKLHDENMDSSAERKHHDDEILEAYLEYEEFMNQEIIYRRAA